MWSYTNGSSYTSGPGYSDASYLLTTAEAQLGTSKFFRSLFHEVLEDKQAVLNRALEIATAVAQKTSGLTGFLTRELIWRGATSPEGAHLLESKIGLDIGMNGFALPFLSNNVTVSNIAHAATYKKV